MLISRDSETEWITDLCKAPRLVCCSEAWREEGEICTALYKWDDPRLLDRIAETLEHDVLTNSNVAFDCAVWMAQWPELTPLIFEAYEQDRVIDTIPVQKLIDIAHGELHRAPKPYKGSNYSLQAMTYRHLDRVLDKTLRENYGELRDVPLDQWNDAERAYPIDDAVANLEVHEIQQLGWPDLLKDQFRQSRHAFWLYLVGAWGIRTDPARVARFKQQLLDEREQHFRVLREHGLIKPKRKTQPNGDQVLCDKLGRARMAQVYPKGPRTAPSATHPEGQASVDYQTCVDCGDPVMLAFGEYASVRKQLTADVPHLEAGELHCRFDSLKETGRTGCSDPYNLQNPPRETGVRECFIPRPGTVFVDADYDGLESRAGAQACLEVVGESTMADVLNRGEDLHLHMAAALLGKDYDTTYRLYKAGDKEAKTARQFAKIANFGLCGGMGADTFFAHAQKELKKVGAIELAKSITWEQCARIREVWRQKWHEWPVYFAINGEKVEDEGYATCKQLFSERYRGGLGYTDLNNTYFQGLGADAAKAAGWRLTRLCYDWTQGSVLYGSRIVNFVHDQFLIEAPTAIAHECAQETGRVMVAEANKWFPDVPATVTPALATCWSKDCAPLYENDRLIPWSPTCNNVKSAA